MASADWTDLDDSLSSGSIVRGVTGGFAPPSGGGSFIYGFNSLDTAPGAAGLFCNLVDFSPAAKGGQITGALKRAPSGGRTGFTPLLFLGLGGHSVNDLGYLLGLVDGDPSRIALRKGALVGGIPDVAPGGSGILARSTGTVAVDEWVHLRLDMIVNLNGDVRLQCFRNDLGAHAIPGPYTWTAIPGIAEVVDDALGVTTGSAPYTSGYSGFAFCKSDVTRRGYFDQIAIERQL